jgi:transcriptional regulator GlxA family with amidase domain
MQPRHVVIVVFPGVQALDFIGPSEVFSMAARLGDGAYTVELVAGTPGPFETSSGVSIVPHRSFASCRGPIDTLLVAGGEGVVSALDDERLLGFVRRASKRARRTGSVCNGAFLLARAGLLDGRRATTHWSGCKELARRHPGIDVDPEPIFVRDGDVYTSAGVTAGIDLSLALVEEDLGPDAALEVARWLVLFVKRPGGQAQFSAELAPPVARREPLRELQAWMVDNLDADLSVPALAERAFMSERHFARAFRDEVGQTPAAYVEGLRVERARIVLESGDEPVEQVALRCGFGTVETMRRAFRRRLNVSPSEYRERFRSAPADIEAA